MHLPFVRLVVVIAAVIGVVSCDGAPTGTRLGSGISGGPTGTAPIVPALPGSPDSTLPFVVIDTPVANPVQLVNVGDSILVVVRLNDDRGLGSVTITGFKETGDTTFGTFQRIERYPGITAPVGGAFPAGTLGATIKRYLKPAAPLDTALGPLVIEAVVRDAAGNRAIARRTIQIVTGPVVTLLSPVNGSDVPRGVAMSVSANATHAQGVDSLIVRVTGQSTWPTRLDTTFRKAFPSGTQNATLDTSIFIPADAPIQGRITITASAVDANGNPGSAAPIAVTVRALGLVAPVVVQTVDAKLEISDSITVTATGDGIVEIGRIVFDSAGNEINRLSVLYTVPTSNRTQRLPLNLGLADQGRRIRIVSFARDNNNPQLTGFSSEAGVTSPVVVTYGRTFTPSRLGTAGDVTVDPVNGNVFLSNTTFNLLEVWSNASKTFSSGGVAVGAQPWGMFVSNSPDTLLVANSGATTISRVCINACAGGVPREVLSRRIRTRNNVIFRVQFVRDPSTGKILLVRQPNISYSDRPQYVVQSQGGRVFYSTRPTSANEEGTIRWLDPAMPVPDPRQIYDYATVLQDAGLLYTIFNADSIRVFVAPATSPLNDSLVIYDHPYGQFGPTIQGGSANPDSAAARVIVQNSDVQIVLNLDVASLALTDTTFVAASGDRSWIGFGEGNTEGGTGRIMMVNDPPGPIPAFFSPGMTVTDIVDNASEKVFGLAIDSTGLQVTSHGLQTYIAALDNPFHLRLDGVYDSFDNGAGVAYHPRARSTLTADPNHRVSFSATASGIIEIIDVAHYNNRGRLTTKGNLYGPIRVTGPLPGDPPEVILKVFGLTARGLVVIDLRAPDIKPGP